MHGHRNIKLEFQMLCSAVRYVPMVTNALWFLGEIDCYGGLRRFIGWEKWNGESPSENGRRSGPDSVQKIFKNKFFGLSEFDTERSGSCCHDSGSGLFTSWPGSRLYWSQCFQTFTRSFAVDTHIVLSNMPHSLLSISYPHDPALHKKHKFVLITNMEAFRGSRA